MKKDKKQIVKNAYYNALGRLSVNKLAKIGNTVRQIIITETSIHIDFNFQSSDDEINITDYLYWYKYFITTLRKEKCVKLLPKNEIIVNFKHEKLAVNYAKTNRNSNKTIFIWESV